MEDAPSAPFVIGGVLQHPAFTKVSRKSGDDLQLISDHFLSLKFRFRCGLSFCMMSHKYRGPVLGKLN